MSNLERILILPFYMATWILSVCFLLGSGLFVLTTPICLYNTESNGFSSRYFLITFFTIILWLVLAVAMAGLGVLGFRLEQWLARKYDLHAYARPVAPGRPRAAKPAAVPRAWETSWRQNSQPYAH
jgi:hypothetical protein